MAAKMKFDPRKMMEKAIEVMRTSVAEGRGDGKPNPLVGAVLVRPDGSVETAARGEFRDGQHAEFTLLERKCASEKLDGCVLFATLEPCLDRNPPKRGCARHIVAARIKTVWVGVEDDNPTVAGKGIEYLRQGGVEIHMFDRDLQDIILLENRKFFEWARQQTGDSKPKPIKLSRYEDPVQSVVLADLSEEALARYRPSAGVEASSSSRRDLHRVLQRQGLLVGDGDAAVPSGFGLLLFGKNPRQSLPQAGVLARAELADGTTSREEFDQAMVLIPSLLERWLNMVLPSTLDRSTMERRERVDLPFEMIREAVVNALVHRDYGLTGQKCQLAVTADTITISSPGGPIPPITLEQMQSFTAPMKSRNPLLHYVFARMGLAEEQGIGLRSLKKQAEKLGLPLPSYSMRGDDLVLTIFRNKTAAIAALSEGIAQQLSNAEQVGWKWLTTKLVVSSAEYATALGIPSRTALNHLKRFVSLQLLERVGSGPTTQYRIHHR